MATDRALLVLADIAGYTRFMKLHRLSLAHAQETTGRLLEAIVDAVPDLDLVEIEGDAAFLHTRARDDASAARSALEAATAMYRAFHAEQQRIASRNRCPCDACGQTGDLRVKFVAHVGDVAQQTIRRRTKLVGLDVIVAHRMLKNDVPLPEYVLLSEPLYERAPAEVRSGAEPLEQELEGIGPARLWFVDVSRVAGEPPPAPAASLAGQLGETAGVIVRGLPHLFSRNRARREQEL